MSDAGLRARIISANFVRGIVRLDVRPLFLQALGVFVVIALVLAIAALAAAKLAASDWRFVVIALCVYAGVAGVALAGLDAHPHVRLGWANMITSIRAGLTALIAAALVEFQRFAPGGDVVLTWALIAVVVLALALDGVDGAAARYQGTNSSFGERFDMEVDALMVLTLSVLAFASGKAGVFVILLGAMRYVYVAIHALFPGLSKELKPSIARKAICVFQIVALCTMMMPVIEPPFSSNIAWVALVLLSASFARDLIAQLGHSTRRAIK